MTQVNLLPSDIRQRQKTRRTTVLVAMAVAGAVALVVAVFFIESGRLASAQNELASQQAQNAALQQQISGLSRYAALATETQQKQQIVTQLNAAVVPWSGVLRDISSVIPDDVYVKSITAQITVTAGTTAPEASDTGLIGSITVQGAATSHDAVAQWLSRVAEVNGWENPWVSSSQLQSDGTTSFSGTIDLAPKVATKGGKG
ncbi:MAG TPA: PilN domain-containing protein [Actinomycetota bacterium]|jgi:Tfp pilus assembly protein PilN